MQAGLASLIHVEEGGEAEQGVYSKQKRLSLYGDSGHKGQLNENTSQFHTPLAMPELIPPPSSKIEA